MWHPPRFRSGWAAAAASLAIACTGQGRRSGVTVAGGDAARGAQAIGTYGCGYCHVIPGVHDATGTAAPPLESFGTRITIAGEAANTPDQLMAWIMDPRAIKPRTLMPNLGVRAADARDIATYLYTLR